MKKVKKNFTLIELMIVVAIIAIIAAIAIPNLLSARMSANETGAIGSLNAIMKAQKMFSDRDCSNNGVQDYHVDDVYGLYATAKAGDATAAIKLIDVATAKSDTMEASTGGYAASDATAYIIASTVTAPAAESNKQGFFIYHLTNDENGDAYAGSAGAYGVAAYPDKYGTTGEKIYIVNQEGVIYYVAGASTLDHITLGAGVVVTGLTDWPDADPSTDTFNGNSWFVAK